MKESTLKQISRSELRHRILAALSAESASSVTSLAQQLEVLRPSVSRTVKTLQNAGFIVRQGRMLVLSEAGQEELGRLDAELSSKVRKSTGLAARILLEQASEARNRSEPLSESPLMQSITPLMRIGEELSNSPILEFSKSLSNSPLLQLSQSLVSSPLMQDLKAMSNNVLQVTEAIKATAGIQTINLNLFQTWQQEMKSPLNHLLLDNNLLLSRMMSDLEAISGMKGGVGKTLSNLINQTALTTKAYDTYFADIVSGFRQIPSFDSLKLSLAIPTTAAASLVGSTRFIVDAEIIAQTEKEPKASYTAKTNIYSGSYEELIRNLEVSLKPLGQRFVDKWVGAWQTLYSGNKDRHSQATHSARELLMQVLAYLAPDDVFSNEDYLKYNVDKPSRKMRIKHILNCEHQSVIKLIDSMASTLDSMYDVLVGEAHSREDKNYLDDNAIAGQLAALGGLLIMLLSLHSNIIS